MKKKKPKTKPFRFRFFEFAASCVRVPKKTTKTPTKGYHVSHIHP
jgi:hypothetical protein